MHSSLPEAEWFGKITPKWLTLILTKTNQEYWVNFFIIQVWSEWVYIGMTMIVLWSDRNCANLNIWVESWQHVHSIWKWGHWYWTIWAFLSGWHANHKFEYIQTFTFNENVARSDVLMKKVSWFFRPIANSNVCNFYCLIWLKFLSIDVSLNHNIQRNTNFHFSFYFDWDLLSIDVFLNIQINTSFHFSFLFQLRFLSIDLFLNL